MNDLQAESDLTLKDVHAKMREYLGGELSLDAFVDWICDSSRTSLAHARTERMSPNTYRVVAYGSPAYELLADLDLMDSEMTCSGSYRTEQMFREDLRSILDGKEPTAFWGPVMDKLVSENYPQWCAQREKDIAKPTSPTRGKSSWKRFWNWLTN